ncbi:MAG: branched-chain amino acid ABC transporter permease [Candidatus Dormibacteraceae bacterium]
MARLSGTLHLAGLGRRLGGHPLLWHLALAVAAAIVLYVITSALSPYNDFQVAQIALYVIALAGLTVLTGANGQISLGHGAFMLVGAYTAAMLLTHTQVPLPVALIASMVASGVFGVIIGVPAVRLRGPYLAGLTLALAIGLPSIPVRFGGIFGGEEGLTVLPPLAPDGIDPERWLSWIGLIAALAVLVLLANLMRSEVGRRFRSVRDDELAAQLVGVKVGATKVLAFVVSAACAGLAGGLLGLASGIVNPGEFPVSLSIGLLAGMVLGGAGSLVGVWWGAIFLVYVPQWATSVAGVLNLSSGASSNLAIVFYGLVLIVLMLVAPRGIQGGLSSLGRWLWALRRTAPTDAAP